MHRITFLSIRRHHHESLGGTESNPTPVHSEEPHGIPTCRLPNSFNTAALFFMNPVARLCAYWTFLLILLLLFILPHPTATRAQDSAGQARGTRGLLCIIETGPMLPLYDDDDILALSNYHRPHCPQPGVYLGGPRLIMLL